MLIEPRGVNFRVEENKAYQLKTQQPELLSYYEGIAFIIRL
jgi:hypothetical protein